MTPLAPHMEAFFREHLVRHRGVSPHTCDSYACSFQSLFEFASQKLRVAPSALMLEQLDASLISSFLEHLETARGNSAETRFAAFWQSPSRKPTIVWCRIWPRKKCRPCSTLLIHPREWEFETEPYCIWRCARASESPN